MLVIFSDIHFSDGTVDPFNVPPYAFRILIDHLQAILERPNNRIESIEVVLLGDIFDLLRSFRIRWCENCSPKKAMLTLMRRKAKSGVVRGWLIMWSMATLTIPATFL